MSIEHMGMVYAAGGIPGPEKALLLAFANFTDPHGYCWPGEDRLADMTGTSVRTVRRSRAKLIGMNLIKSVRRTDKVTGDPITNLTRVNLRLIASMKRPDPVYDDNMIGRILFDDDEGPEDEDPEPGPAQTGSDLLTGQIDLRLGTDCPEGEDTLACGTGQIGLLSVSEPSVDPSGEPAHALSARSAGERRRQTTGSRGEREGGSAASGKTSPPQFTPTQRQAVQAVRDLLPPDLNRALGEKTPGNIQAGIIAALAAGTPRERTVEQLVRYRLMPRWERYWAVRFYTGELTPKQPSGRPKEPFGPLSQMLADTPECGNLSCENRHDFVTEAACQQCEMRKVDRRADRAKERQGATENTPPQPQAPSLPMPSQRASQSQWWDCNMCPASGKGEPPADGICRACREKAAAAVAWTDPEGASHEEPAAAATDADLAAAAAEEQRLAEEAALDARLRAEQAAMYGSPEQQAMYATNAPF